jgi:hypothetical protein
VKAKITSPHGYKCAPEGHTTVHFDVGSIVEGHIAEMAIADGAAMAFQDMKIETKVVAPSEAKAPTEVKAPVEAPKKGRTRK